MKNRRGRNRRSSKKVDNQSGGQRMFIINQKNDPIARLRAEQIAEGRRMMMAELKSGVQG
jgi:hypothetical protein